MSNFITVKQLPVIEEALKEIGADFDLQVTTAQALVCTAESLSSVKKTRSDLNKKFGELEDQRKAAKNAIMKPYDDFNALYKEHISDKYSIADKALAKLVNDFEAEEKRKIEEAVREYYSEYAAAVLVDWVPFEKAGISITKSASMKSLKDACKKFLDSVVDDISLIKLQPNHVEEMLVEYKDKGNAAQAVKTVLQRRKDIEAVAAREAEKALLEVAEAATEQAVSEVVAKSVQAPVKVKVSPPCAPDPEEPTEKILQAELRISGTLEQLKALREYMDARGISYTKIGG